MACLYLLYFIYIYIYTFVFIFVCMCARTYIRTHVFHCIVLYAMVIYCIVMYCTQLPFVCLFAFIFPRCFIHLLFGMRVTLAFDQQISTATGLHGRLGVKRSHPKTVKNQYGCGIKEAVAIAFS